MADETLRLARDHLCAFVDRIERLNEEIKGLNTDKRDLYAEAKANGFDDKALKIVVQRRAKDPDALTELDAIVETYESQLGTTPAINSTRGRAPARPAAPNPQPIATTAAKVVAAILPPAAHPEDANNGIPPILDRRASARM